ncbi:dolichyl-phosphate-mannose---protein mannosyltransferase [Synchytrium endobioticum]|uniref:dolichyl-phosphate-mannose--protein mannosyltransferase n=1 Tax=Synchytrium endobioticum TaxID=286115 RepID=A0A507CCD4_9FUNG|nr:dolichyl-phosphate-mannose---protein mannosyltransferase [Synchytrium endobioticum]
MSSVVRFTPLSGAHSDAPLCYLLEIEEARILLDCGWTETFDVDELHSLQRYLKHIDAILLSHGDLDHLGALPYLVTKLGLSCPVYGTLPVYEMGKRTLLDALSSRTDAEDFTLFTEQDVIVSFDKMVQLRFMQTETLKGRATGIQITPYPAGHTVGGAIWKIKEDTNDILYAVDYNHLKERHLDPTVLHQNPPIDAFNRPSVLITDAYNAINNPPSRKNRETTLFDALATAMQNDASVLIPIDTSTRVLEIAYMLESYWRSKNLTTPLFLLTHQASRTIATAKVLLEWMGESIEREFSGSRDNPFEFKKVQLAHSLKELDKTGNAGKVVLASMPGMEHGFSRDLFIEWSSMSKNLIILTDRGNPNSMTRKLYKQWQEAADTDSSYVRVLSMDLSLNISKKVPLEGDELAQYREKEAREKENENARLLQARALRGLDDDSESDDESLDLNVTTTQPLGRTSSIAELPKHRNSLAPRDAFTDSTNLLLHNQYDAYVRDAHRVGGFFKQSQSFRMFPVHESRKRVDEYGEQIDIAIFAKAELPYAAIQAAEEAASKAAMAAQEEAKPKEEIIPTKVVEETLDFVMKCNILFVDFEGRADGRSVRNIIPQLQARKVILIHGSEEATASLLQSFSENSQVTDDIYAPVVGEVVNASSSTNIYRVRLTDTLVSSLNIRPLDDYALAYVTGIVRRPESTTATLLSSEDELKPDTNGMEVDSEQPGNIVTSSSAPLPSTEETLSTETPVLDIILASERPSHHPVVVGEVKLTEFRRILENDGMQADFNSGVLIVNRKVAVKREREKREIVLDGWVGEDYYRVRKRWTRHVVRRLLQFEPRQRPALPYATLSRVGAKQGRMEVRRRKIPNGIGGGTNLSPSIARDIIFEEEQSAHLYNVDAVDSLDLPIAGGLVIIAAIVRLFQISQPPSVVFDEVHFGGFAGKYIKGTFFMDVHPPLGKLLIASAGVLAGFDGNFSFKDIGMDYIEPRVPYVAMRLVPAICGILTVPVAYMTMRNMNFSIPGSLLAALFLVFENGFTCLSRHILLDSILIFFVALTCMMWTDFLSQQRAFTFNWWYPLTLTGVSLGMALSVKWVGLFVVGLIGISTIHNLWEILGDLRVTPWMFIQHFMARALCLIVVPSIVYAALFAVHFLALPNTGSGAGFMSPEFQSTLRGNEIKDCYADVAYGAKVYIRHEATNGGWLHSHKHYYPTGSKQQQITLYPFRDDNSWFLLKKPLVVKNGTLHEDPISGFQQLKNGDTVRLEHIMTHKSLHSHDHRAPVTENEDHNEVSGYGTEGFLGDTNDHWRFEVANQKADDGGIRAIETKFRLAHVNSGCKLFSHAVKLPEWGFGQQEVTCAKKGRPDLLEWRIEANEHPEIPANARLVNYKKPGFFRKFIEIHKVMWDVNEGLTGSHPYDSRAASWPYMGRGISYWSSREGASKQIFLIGNPFVWWAASLSTMLSLAFFLVLAVLRKRQIFVLSNNGWRRLSHVVFLYFGWVLHYVPFFLPKRQLFLHHYFPALYFSILLLAACFDLLASKSPRSLKYLAVLILTCISSYVYIRYAPMTYGLHMDPNHCESLKIKLPGLRWNWECYQHGFALAGDDEPSATAELEGGAEYGEPDEYVQVDDE